MVEVPLREAENERFRALLCEMQSAIRDGVLRARDASADGALAAVAGVTEADTIYHVDRISEDAIVAWLEDHWPRDWPLELVMEGLEEGVAHAVPTGTPVAETRLKLIVDPIDGTRAFMYDKRSAWVLAAVAPQRGPATSLSDVCAAAMTELPPRKQRLADQVSAVRGCGLAGLVAERVDLDGGRTHAFRPRPSQATDLHHGFAAFARFFPAAKSLIAQFEESLWRRLYGDAASRAVDIFDDQYICSGGQLYELLVGHDRLLGDIRPLALPAVGASTDVTCHPYDVCVALILEEAGCPVGDPWGGVLDVPLDTTSPVAWVGFCNETLAALVRPALLDTLAEFFPDAG